MRFLALSGFAVALALAACTAASTEGGSSDDALLVTHGNITPSTDAGTVSTDGGVAKSDAGSVDGGVVSVDAGPAVPTYAEEAPVIQDKCGGCHGSKFSTLAQVKADRAEILSELQEGKMPKDDKTFNTTPDGEQLIDFLTNSPELN